MLVGCFDLSRRTAAAARLRGFLQERRVDFALAFGRSFNGSTVGALAGPRRPTGRLGRLSGFRARRAAADHNAPLGILTFEPHPREYFAPDARPSA